MNYKELAEQALDYIVEQRRWCHQNPELSLEEVILRQSFRKWAIPRSNASRTIPDYVRCCGGERPKRRAELWLSGRILMPCR